MKSYLRPTPIFCTAIGTASGFYLIGFIPIFIFFSLLLAVSLLFHSFVIFCQYAAKINYKFNIDRKVQFFSTCTFAFSVGLIIGIFASSAGNKQQQFGFLPETINAIEGVLLEDPRIISSGNAIASISLQRSFAKSSVESYNMNVTSSGEITVFFPQEKAEKIKEFGRGTAVYSEGSLRRSGSDGNWIFRADTMFIVKPASPIERMRTNMRLSLINRFNDKKWGGLALALLLGVKDNLDSDLTAMYRNAGCSYILALSGMHLAVLAAVISFLLKPALGLKPAAVLGAVIICLYCFLVGPMPSLNRAALMYLLGVVAILGFLPKQPLAILSLSFIIQIIITPAAGYSISFILSYLALFGIFIIGQPLYELFAGKVPDILLQPLSASCGAFLATAGITGTVFGYVAPVGIGVGLILVPLTTLYMILSLGWLFLDFISLSSFLSAPLSFLYTLTEKIVSVASRFPAVLANEPLNIIIISIIVSVLIIVFEYVLRKSRLKLEPFYD